MTAPSALQHLAESLLGHDAAAKSIGREPGQWIPVRRAAVAAVVSSYYRDTDTSTPPIAGSQSDYDEDLWSQVIAEPGR